MNRQEYLEALRKALSDMPYSEVEKSVMYCSEIIDDKIEDGMTEQQAVDSMDDISSAARQIKLDQSMGTLIAARANSAGKKLSTAAIIVGAPLWAAFAAIVFAAVITMYAVLWAIDIALWAVFAAFAAVGAFGPLIAAYMFTVDARSGCVILAGSLVSAGLAIFMFILNKFLSRQLIRFTAFIWRKLKTLFVRKKVER